MAAIYLDSLPILVPSDEFGENPPPCLSPSKISKYTELSGALDLVQPSSHSQVLAAWPENPVPYISAYETPATGNAPQWPSFQFYPTPAPEVGFFEAPSQGMTPPLFAPTPQRLYNLLPYLNALEYDSWLLSPEDQEHGKPIRGDASEDQTTDQGGGYPDSRSLLYPQPDAPHKETHSDGDTSTDERYSPDMTTPTSTPPPLDEDTNPASTYSDSAFDERDGSNSPDVDKYMRAYAPGKYECIWTSNGVCCGHVSKARLVRDHIRRMHYKER